jgi:hypothetical protein
VILVLHQDEDTTANLAELFSTREGCVTVVADVVALVGMVPFLIIEGATLYAYGTGWFSAWNALDIAMYSAQVRARIFIIHEIMA